MWMTGDCKLLSFLSRCFLWAGHLFEINLQRVSMFSPSQAAHTPRPCSRRPSLYCLAATATSTSTVLSPAACSAPAASRRRDGWTVAAGTAEVRWCASVPEGVGWFTGSRPGVTPAGPNSPPASTPKCPPSAPGSVKWSDVMTGRGQARTGGWQSKSIELLLDSHRLPSKVRWLTGQCSSSTDDWCREAVTLLSAGVLTESTKQRLYFPQREIVTSFLTSLALISSISFCHQWVNFFLKHCNNVNFFLSRSLFPFTMIFFLWLLLIYCM